MTAVTLQGGGVVTCPVSRLKAGLTLVSPVLWVSISLLLLLLPVGSCDAGDAPCPAEETALLLSPLIASGKIHLAQEKSRVRCLPGADLESYSGFISVDKPECGSNLFFWFFPAQERPKDAPLLLWLNGGPGRSSMYGAMFENGPYELTNTVSLTVVRRNVTWVKYFSMLYVDNPVGAGYSHTLNNCYSTTLNESTANLYSFLQQFFVLFPQFSKNDFYIGGQSYAGKYVPTLGYYIHHRMDSDDKPRMRLKGIYIGSGYCDPLKMQPEMPEMLYSVGIYSDFDRRQHLKRIADGWSKPNRNPFYPEDGLFWDIMIYYDTMGHPTENTYNFYDYRLDGDQLINWDKLLVRYLSKPSVQNALHVGRRPGTSGAMPNPFNPLESIEGVRKEMALLMDHYKVLHYTGNMDIIVNVRMTEAYLMATPWSGQADYNNSQRHPWWYNGRLAGFYTKVHNFTRVIIRNAGHDAPRDQPEWTLAMMQWFINDQSFSPFSTSGAVL
ncbi:probable serine carboxypeptidase CPVL isoform X1 [Pomacea canaliculata]|uniref:probable serine carboxypeptidase CPVL isoform X1 n=1 Tax=Pomacea canaliculata TaxID=400727 RepID=UPI000D7308E3|nr:probable serine carboxypeptidase CPVL isoform X1 [Pomacea canaliculata]